MVLLKLLLSEKLFHQDESNVCLMLGDNLFHGDGFINELRNELKTILE